MPNPTYMFEQLQAFQTAAQVAYTSFKHGNTPAMTATLESMRIAIGKFLEELEKERGGRAWKERDIEERTG